MGPEPHHRRRSKPPPLDLRAGAKLASRVLSRAVDELDHFVREDGARVNPNRWRPLAARGDSLQLFRERETAASGGAIDPRALPALLVSGRLRGRVESALFAAASDSQEHLALLHTFLFGEQVVEGSVVAAIKQLPASSAEASPASQPTFTGAKAVVKQIKTPREQLVAKVEFLEHRGYTSAPVGGELVAFYVLVPVSERVKGSESSGTSTARLELDRVAELSHVESLCCLFRQVSDDVVDVFLYANADLSGALFGTSGGKAVPPEAALLTAESLMNVASLLECAETKRLTVMMRQAQQAATVLTRSKPSECAMCHQKKRLFFGGGTAFSACEVCGNYVCGRCRIDKRVFVPRLSQGGCGGGVLEKVSACKPCSMAASSGHTMAEAPAMVLSERVRVNRAASHSRGTVTSSSFGSHTRSRTGSGCSSSSGSTTSSLNTRVVYYEGDFNAKPRSNSSMSSAVSSAGLRTRSSAASTMAPRSAAGSVPPSPIHHHKLIDRSPQLSSRQRRHESFEGVIPTRGPPSNAQTPTNERRVAKERARSEDWVAPGPEPHQTDRFPRFTPAMPMPSSRSRHDSAGAMVPVPPSAPSYAVTDARRRVTSSPSAPTRSHRSGGAASPQDFMQRMVALHQMAELNYDTTQRNGAMMARHLRSK